MEIVTFDKFEISAIIDGEKEYNQEALDRQSWFWETRDEGGFGR